MSDFAPGLSAVMITRNAAKYLPMALRALRRVVDEIVVVDTGSTDTTCAIAMEEKCRLFEFAWCDDFSRAKNFAIDQARHDWIISVDADEVLYDRRAPELLGEALLNRDVPAYVVWVDNVYDSGRVEPFRVLRLFRNTPLLRFANPVHESIGEALYANWPGFVPPVLDLHLRHYGYLSANVKGKHGRNLSLLRKWAAADPANIYANYKLGGTLLEAGEGEEARVFLERTFALFAASLDRGSYPFLVPFLATYCGLLEATGFAERAGECRGIAAGWR